MGIELGRKERQEEEKKIFNEYLSNLHKVSNQTNGYDWYKQHIELRKELKSKKHPFDHFFTKAIRNHNDNLINYEGRLDKYRLFEEFVDDLQIEKEEAETEMDQEFINKTPESLMNELDDKLYKLSLRRDTIVTHSDKVEIRNTEYFVSLLKKVGFISEKHNKKIEEKIENARPAEYVDEEVLNDIISSLTPKSINNSLFKGVPTLENVANKFSEIGRLSQNIFNGK